VVAAYDVLGARRRDSRGRRFDDACHGRCPRRGAEQPRGRGNRSGYPSRVEAGYAECVPRPAGDQLERTA